MPLYYCAVSYSPLLFNCSPYHIVQYFTVLLLSTSLCPFPTLLLLYICTPVCLPLLHCGFPYHIPLYKPLIFDSFLLRFSVPAILLYSILSQPPCFSTLLHIIILYYTKLLYARLSFPATLYYNNGFGSVIFYSAFPLHCILLYGTFFNAAILLPCIFSYSCILYPTLCYTCTSSYSLIPHCTVLHSILLHNVDSVSFYNTE